MKKGIYASPKLVSVLKSAVIKEILTKMVNGRLAHLGILITQARMVSSGARILTGVLSGSNKLYITAVLKDQNDSEKRAEYNVKESYNPGRLGVFINPEMSTANAVAETLVSEIYKGLN